MAVPYSLRCLVMAVTAMTLTTAVPATAKQATQAQSESAPSSPQQHGGGAYGAYLAGRFAQRVDDWDAASRYLALALADDPNDMALLNRAIVLDVSSGKVSEAVPLARRMEKLKLGTHLSGTIVAIDDLTNKNPTAARDMLAKLPSDGLTRFVTPLLMAWGEAAAGNTKAALDQLGPRDGQPGFASLNALHAAVISDLAGDHADAAKRYADAVATSVPLRAVQLVANFDEREQHPEAAQALFQRFVEANPDSVLSIGLADKLAHPSGKPKPIITSPREGMAEALFSIGSALHQEGADELGLLYGRLALYLRPDFPLAQMMVADILTTHSHMPEALALFRQAQNDDALGWMAKLRMADNLDAQKKTDEAVTLLSAMVKDQPTRTDAAETLGDMLRRANRTDAAIAAYDTAIARVKTVEHRHWTLFYGRGLAYDQAKRWDECEKDLEQAESLNPDDAYLLNYLGYSWVDRNEKLDHAKELIEHAVDIRPDDGHIVDSLGWVLFRMGDNGGAVEQLERAVELRPQDAAINDHLGDAYWAAGRHLEARFQWERALHNAAGDEPDLVTAVKAKLAAHEVHAQAAASPE